MESQITSSNRDVSKVVKKSEKHGLVKFFADRRVRLVIYVLACFFTSALYYGWQQYQKMLLRDGAYSWMCPGEEQCEEQEDKVSVLYSVAAGCEYASAALGGMFLDHLGPRRSALIGELTWGLGTLLLALSSKSFQAYIPAMIVIGSSVNVVCFPALATVDAFPKWQGLMVGVTLAAQNAATGVPPVLYAIQVATNASLRTIWLLYLVCVWLPVTLLYLAALPSGRELGEMLKLQRRQMLEKEGGTGLLQQIEEEGNFEIVRGKASWSEFVNNLMCMDVAVMSVWFLTMMLMYAYYPTVVAYAISDKMSDYMGYIMPAQAFFALLVGVVCDYFSTTTVMIGMCVVLELIFVLCMMDVSEWVQYLACTLLVVTQCAIFEVKFTYCQEMWDPYNFGKLVGFFGVLGGCGTFLNIAVSSGDSYNRVFAAYSATLPVLCIMAWYLGHRQRHGVCYKTMPDAVHAEQNQLLPQVA